MSIEQDVWNFLRNKNLPEKSVAAVMGNIEAESEFNISLIEKGNGIGFGLCQWSFGRRTKLEAYGTDLTHQLNFLWAELSGQTGNTGASFEWINKDGYLSHSNFMIGNGSIADLTAAMCFSWERPNVRVAHLERRQQKAQEYFNQFTGSSGPPSANSQQDTTIESTNYEVIQGSSKQGDILYGRRYRVTVSDDKGNGVDVSQLRCNFSIVKTIQMEPNYSQIVIYNLNTQTENAIQLSATRVTVEAGYEGRQYGLIFDGDILQIIRDKEDSTNYRLTIIALDSDRAINFDIANYSVLRGQTARTLVDHIVNQAQYPVSLGSVSSSLDESPALTRGKVFFGKSSDYLRQIADSNECKYYTDTGQINLVKMEDLPEGEIFDLNPSSGLIGTPEQSEYGITGQCLLNPAIKVNSLLHIDNSLVRAKQISIGGSNNTVPSIQNTASSTIRDKIIAEAKKICDDPNVQYSQPNRGQTIGGITYWDCSSFVKHCYEIAGLSIVDIARNQYNQVASEGGKFISKEEALPGDLVFWGKGSACYHIAIYAGNGFLYAARGRDGKEPQDQVAYHALYGDPEFGRPKSLIDAEQSTPPSANGTNTGSNSAQTPVYRSLDKDGIYRVIKVTYEGDTRGDSWYCNFETITQAGGQIPLLTN